MKRVRFFIGLCLGLSIGFQSSAAEDPSVVVSPDNFTNTLVVAGESLTQTMIISNTGNSDLEFSFCPPPASRDDGLILHYTFENDSGTTVVDQSGNGNDGTAMNNVEYTTGVNGQGLEIHGNSSTFSSSGGHVLLPEINFNAMDSTTISLWVKEEIMHHYGGESYISFGSTPASRSLVTINHFYSNMEFFTGTEGLLVAHNGSDINQFTHYAMTYSAGIMRAYRNGELLGEQPGALEVGDPSLAALGRHWWASGASSSTRLTAVYDEVRIYNRALSDAEISDLYSEGEGDGLVAHFPFNGNADDESGNGHDGTVVGATLVSDRFGNPGSAFDFDGINDYMDLGIMGGIKSVSIWIKQQPRNGFDFYFGHMDFRLYASTAENGRLTLSEGSHALFTSVHMEEHIGQWNHIVAVSDGLDSKVYFNGVDVTISSGDLKSIGNTAVNLGRWPGPTPSATHYLNGEIDDVRIYNRVLSEAEIQALYAETDGDGLVAHYPFNGNADDESGNGHDGVELGSVTYADGIDGMSASFNGTDAKIKVPHSEDLNLSGSLSISCWLKSTGTNPNSGIITKMQSNVPRNGYLLTANTGYPADVQVYLNKAWPSTIGRVVLTDGLFDGNWHHITTTYDGESLILYKDGQVEIEVAYTNGLTPNSLPLYIGWDPYYITSQQRYFNGQIDEVHIYNRALSELEILELYSGSSEQECALPDWLAVEPKFGTIPAGSSIEVAVTLGASNMVAGDYVEHILNVYGSGSAEPIGSVPVSMWVVPPAPVMVDEPAYTEWKSNEVFWSEVEGPVEYWVEATAIEHSSPGSKDSTKPIPRGWSNVKRFHDPSRWMQESDWIASTNYLFTDLRLNTRYQYRVKASVVTDIGRLESAWSDWVESCQVPHVRELDASKIPDWWKQKHFGASANFHGLVDSDGDGLCDFDEYVAGALPFDARSNFKVKECSTCADGHFILNWDSLLGREYSVYWSESVAKPFQLLEDCIRYPQNSYTDSVHNAESGGFYKIDVKLDE